MKTRLLILEVKKSSCPYYRATKKDVKAGHKHLFFEEICHHKQNDGKKKYDSPGIGPKKVPECCDDNCPLPALEITTHDIEGVR